MASSFTRFLDHTQGTTIGRTLPDVGSAHHRDLYLTTPTTDRHPCPPPPVGFEPRVSAGERAQGYAIDHVAIGISKYTKYISKII